MSFDDLIRSRAGHGPPRSSADSDQTPEPRHTSFDGGARADPPAPPAPSLDGLLRADRSVRREHRDGLASNFDRLTDSGNTAA